MGMASKLAAIARSIFAADNGNVGIGTSSPSPITGGVAVLSLGGTNSTVSGGIAYQVNGTVKGYDYVESDVRKIQTVSLVPIAFAPGGNEQGRLDTSGWWLLGITSVGNTWSGTAAGNGLAFNPAYSAIQNSTNTNLYLSKKTGYTASAFIEFYVNGSAKGNINTNGTTVAYNTSSDYRLKENVVPMTGALSIVQQLKPCTYTWKEDGSHGQGFIAHELQAVVPDAVTGEKDAVETYTTDDGVEQVRPKYQGIDTSFLVATLAAAIQEQQAQIEQLTARIAALEPTP